MSSKSQHLVNLFFTRSCIRWDNPLGRCRRQRNVESERRSTIPGERFQFRPQSVRRRWLQFENQRVRSVQSEIASGVTRKVKALTAHYFAIQLNRPFEKDIFISFRDYGFTVKLPNPVADRIISIPSICKVVVCPSMYSQTNSYLKYSSGLISCTRKFISWHRSEVGGFLCNSPPHPNPPQRVKWREMIIRI